ncbi:MAG: hypothetical protein CMK32_01800 [Porticoccaceae bacterium]|nr:hypothetical protein [Porticoccaceae bacterium]
MTLSMIFIIPDFMSRAGYYVKSSVLRIIVTLMLAVLAQAGQAESFEQRLENRLETDDVVEVYEWLQSIEDEYGDQVPYLDLRSRFAMRLEDYANAIPVLERLIEVQPGHMGARLDLVIALQLEGRSFEARQQLIELNSLITDKSELPVLAARQLEELNKLLLNGEHDRSNTLSGFVSLGLGHDTNANRGAENRFIRVKLPGDIPIDLELAPESLKTSDPFAEFNAVAEYGAKGQYCQYERCRLWIGGVRFRRYSDLDEFDQRQVYLGTRVSYGGRLRREYTLMAQNVVSSELEFSRIDEQNILSLEYRQLIPGYRYFGGSVRGELIDETRGENATSYLGSLGLNGRIQTGGEPAFQKVNRFLIWTVEASWHTRPDYFAGDTLHLSASAKYPFRMFDTIQGSLGARYNWRRDGDPFNRIFFGDTRREDQEWVISAQLNHPLSERWLLSGNLSHESIESNIELFDVSRSQLSIGIGYQF